MVVLWIHLKYRAGFTPQGSLALSIPDDEHREYALCTVDRFYDLQGLRIHIAMLWSFQVYGVHINYKHLSLHIQPVFNALTIFFHSNDIRWSGHNTWI